MGRSGGGIRSGGGGGGGGHHHSPRHHSPRHHHHHRHFSPSPHYHHYYSSGGGGIFSCACAIVIFFVILIAFVIAVLTSNNTFQIVTELTACEQIISCPDSLKDNTISYSTSSRVANAYVTKKVPDILSDTFPTTLKEKGKYLRSGEYAFHSFNLVAGSTLSWDITAKSSFSFFLLRGAKEMDNFEKNENFNYIKKSSSSKAQSSYTASVSDEYFAVIDSYYYSTTLNDYTFSVNHKRFDLSNYVSRTNTTSTIKIDKSLVPGMCVIIDMPCGVDSSIKVSLKYDMAHGTVYYVCLAFAIVFGVGTVALVAGCIICIFKKNVKQQGTTYNQVPSTSDGQTPTYPAAYQQPQPPAVYQQPTSYQQPQPAYNPNVTPYPGNPPASAPPAFVPTYAPGYDPNYGAAPQPY